MVGFMIGLRGGRFSLAEDETPFLDVAAVLKVEVDDVEFALAPSRSKTPFRW